MQPWQPATPRTLRMFWCPWSTLGHENPSLIPGPNHGLHIGAYVERAPRVVSPSDIRSRLGEAESKSPRSQTTGRSVSLCRTQCRRSGRQYSSSLTCVPGTQKNFRDPKAAHSKRAARRLHPRVVRLLTPKSFLDRNREPDRHARSSCPSGIGAKMGSSASFCACRRGALSQSSGLSPTTKGKSRQTDAPRPCGAPETCDRSPSSSLSKALILASCARYSRHCTWLKALTDPAPKIPNSRSSNSLTSCTIASAFQFMAPTSKKEESGRLPALTAVFRCRGCGNLCCLF